jgi:ribonuclease PH
VIGERTIVVDCDVLQADGGTRAAAITAASLALAKAQEHWLQRKVIAEPFLLDEVAAVSVGVMGQNCLLDLDFAEDSMIDADFNIILTKSHHIIEIQGTAEKVPLSWHTFEEIRRLACDGVEQIFSFIADRGNRQADITQQPEQERKKAPMFSLQNRLNIS